MIQAFVSLKLHQPPRTESGMRSFFEALQGAVFSQPTIFRTNADASVRAYSLDAVVEAALNPGCKFVVLRAEREKFWQCTFLLPDKQGMGALFFDLQKADKPRRLLSDTLIEMFKKLYQTLSPRIIRIGDSVAREQLKSRHGLVLMPGLGRIEWLQIVAPEVYSDIYNPTDLVVAPGYSAEIWEDGALFLRVYDDPNDWESEDNISQANFIPGFLAGIAKIKDSEKEKETLRDLERLWARAEKTAKKAYEVLNQESPSSSDSAPVQAAAAEPAEEVKEEAPAAPAVQLEGQDLDMRNVVYDRLRSEFKVDEHNIVKVCTEGSCTIFKVKTNDKKPDFFVSYQDFDLKVFILNSIEDLSRFISANDCTVKASDIDKIRYILKTYYHPEYTLLESLDQLPAEVQRDRRIPEIKKSFKPSEAETNNDVQEVTFWFYRPDIMGLETLKMTQCEGWPLQLEARTQCTEMENEPEEAPAASASASAPAASAAEPAKAPEAAPVKPAETASPVTAPIKHEEAKPIPRTSAVAKTETAAVPAKSSASAGKIIVGIILILVIAAAVVYFVKPELFGLPAKGAQPNQPAAPAAPANPGTGVQ